MKIRRRTKKISKVKIGAYVIAIAMFVYLIFTMIGY